MLIRLLKHWFAPPADALPSLSDDEAVAVRVQCSDADVLRALPLLCVTDGTLVIESTFARSVQQWLREHATSSGRTLTPGTVWPKSDWWYIVLDSPVLRDFADFVDTDGSPVSAHVYVYDAAGVVLEWTDAWFDPIRLAKRLDPAACEAFARAVGGTIKDSFGAA
jgi:hypothetical protein